jgi:ATP-dependent DNA helicase RecQ
VDIYHQILSRYWGYGSFRPLQEDIIRSIAGGKDTLGLMPTGGGKSITFQVPALATEGVCLVVTPLIALMKDQVDNLRKVGIKATAVYSGMEHREIITQLENCIFGDYKFLYASPERLGSELFRAKLKAMNVSFIVVDESHCISQWGYDFRPSYLSISSIRELLDKAPILALTATATPKVADDIQEKLLFREKNVFRTSFYRPNLAYVVREADDKMAALAHILRKVPGSAIVYVRSRMRTKEIAESLLQAGISASYYHAGLDGREKNIRQDLWKEGEYRVMVATNAFGMGIDKPDVRVVAHFDMPGSIEEYFQEAGRAGRDGQKAYAVALYAQGDKAKLAKRFADEFPPKELVRRIYDALGNFYQIAMGYGFESIHDFPLMDFCRAYKFSLQQVHAALKILELSGYIEYQEEGQNMSRLLFTVTRDDLYKYFHREKQTNEILGAVLRLYTGLFADYAFINEGDIASLSGYGPEVVYETLTALSKRRIINYIPQKKTPRIIYTRSREELKYLEIPRRAYEERRERAESRTAKVAEYLAGANRCRSRVLLDYFGEASARNCGQCDVCLAGKAAPEVPGNLRESLLQLLAAAPLPLDEIVERLPYPAAEIRSTVHYLAETEGLLHLLGGNYELRITNYETTFDVSQLRNN